MIDRGSRNSLASYTGEGAAQHFCVPEPLHHKYGACSPVVLFDAHLGWKVASLVPS